MFRDKAFNLSILFSSIWHLCWISFIGITITPDIQPGNFHQEVSFLGPILEKTAFDLMVEGAKPRAETLYAKSTLSDAKSTLFVGDVYLKPKGPQRKILKEFIFDDLRERFSFSLRDYIKDTKEIPLYLAEEIMVSYKAQPERKLATTLVEGPAREREIIFKPLSLTVPPGLYGDREEHIVKLKFFVSNNGVVHDVEPVISSGYLEIDLQATKFLKRWRFSPLSSVEKDKSTWGIVPVKVVIK